MAESIDAVLVEAARLTAAGRPTEAVEVLRPLLVTHPDHSEAWCRLAAALLDAGDFQLCLDAAKRAITLGERSWAHRLASLSLAEMGRHDEAIVSAREAARRDPGDWRSLVTLSEVLGPAAPEESLAVALGAVDAAPEVPRVHEVLGIAAARAGDNALARRAYTDALLLDPGNAEVSARLDALPEVPLRRGAPAANGFARRLTGGGADYSAARPTVIDSTVVESRVVESRVVESRVGESSMVESGVADSGAAAGSGGAGDGGALVDGGGLVDGGAAADGGVAEGGVVEEPAEDRWTVESEWRQRMSAVWPVPAKPVDAEIEPVIQVVADPGFAVHPGRASADRAPADDHPVEDVGEVRVGARPRPRRRTREIPVVEEPAAPPRPVAARPTHTGFTRAKRVSLWLVLRRCSGWLAIGGFVLLVAGMPSPSPLLVWFALALLLIVTGAAAFGYRAIPVVDRPTPRELADHAPLIALAAALTAFGLVMLGVWTLALAFGATGTQLLVTAIVLGVAPGVLAWFGLWRIRTASR
ncbi:tetratricopeptide repeat protein [Actinokineospora terrae]|uniref:Tetratricopeptide repeat-containing protein n=1 Tax=Actinokineospora terrae TaxID=155974 RepID=A0A1H9L0M7_9PSEU|nr:tetratricopeptide repeat protein [Actinokineospora terrae]SER04809.1 Tetratricopeptide repeat-containing protein [Actinokineospora terrae]